MFAKVPPYHFISFYNLVHVDFNLFNIDHSGVSLVVLVPPIRKQFGNDRGHVQLTKVRESYWQFLSMVSTERRESKQTKAWQDGVFDASW